MLQNLSQISISKIESIENKRTVLSDKEVIERLLSNDPAFEYHFFYKQCAPLLSKIRWDVFDNQVEFNELDNELMLLLKTDDWNKLRTFGYLSTLFCWLKTVALRHFNAIRNDLKPEKTFDEEDDKEELDLESHGLDEIKKLLNKVVIPKYRDILRMKYLESKTDEEIREDLSVSIELYNKLKSKAEKHLIRVIRNEGELCVNMFLKVSGKKNAQPPEATVDPVGDIIAKIDLENLINLIPSERIRLVLTSLLIKDMEVKEVAEKLDISVPNLYVLKSRGIKQLTLLALKDKNYGKH